MGWVDATRLHRHGMLILFTAGHAKPICALSARIVQERRDVTITLLTVGDLRQKMEREISRSFSDSKFAFGPTRRIR